MIHPPLYTLDYSQPSSYIQIGEYQVPLPKKPPLKEMYNYGKKPKDQYFQRTVIPESLKRKKNLFTPEEEQFIADEHHRRQNGIWMLIKGEPYYIPGPFYFFLNYWTTKDGPIPNFRYSQWRIFMFWDMCVRDPNSYGMFLVKPRRIGGTEITLCIIYEFCTRRKNVTGGMQSKNEDSIYENYKRMLKSHRKMIWYMQPVHKGSTDNKEGLFFSYPAEMNSKARLLQAAEEGGEIESIYTDEELASEITYKPSIAGAYDGTKLERWTLNEFGKMEKMSVLGCWDKVKPTLHLDNGMVIIGKALLESTIEEIDAKQLDEVSKMHTYSDPFSLDANGRTTSGLYRLFISAIDAASEDEYGFPREDQTREFLENELSNLRKKGDTKGFIDKKRKTPLCIEDALMPSGEQSAFNIQHLQENLGNLDYALTDNKKQTIRGNFIWDKGLVDTRVIFVIDPNGKWEVSYLPKDIDNAYVLLGSFKHPKNNHLFCFGCDPFDHKETSDRNKRSKGGGVIYRKYDDLLDGSKYDEFGNPYNGAIDFETEQPIAIYCAREDDPNVFFEDMLMAAVFYGCEMLFENNKQGIRSHFQNRGYAGYIMDRPESTKPNPNAKTPNQKGAPATEGTITQYFDAITSWVEKFWNANKHRELCSDLLQLNYANRTKHDLGVAFGWALIARNKKFFIKKESAEPQEWFEEHYV